MNKKDESRQNICWILLNCARYSLTLLVGAVLFSDSVGAISHSSRLMVTNPFKGASTRIKNTCTDSNKAVEAGFVCGTDDLSFWSDKRNTGLIAQQPENNSQQSTRAAAQKAYDEGNAFYKEGSAESLRQAVKKLELALQLWQKVGDEAKQALTLNNIGYVYSDLGEKQKALAFYNQALPLRRAVGDKRGEATTLNNIGGVYHTLGEKQKALAFCNQALSMLRAVGDKRGEATTLSEVPTIKTEYRL